MQEKFTYFWSGPFSQWHSSRFVLRISETKYDDVGNIISFGVGPKFTFNCAEQWMMYNKAKLFDSCNKTGIVDKILASNDPREQKKLGRKVPNFDPEYWDDISSAIVLRGNVAKFLQNEDLLLKLLGTKGTILVEASPYDKIWGIGLSEDDPLAKDRKTWKGRNKLGFILTLIRERILEGKNLILPGDEDCFSVNFSHHIEYYRNL